MRLRLSILLILALSSALSTNGCVRTREVKVPVPVVIRPPACLGAGERPPVPPVGTTPADAAWAQYYRRLVAWAWVSWAKCGPGEGSP
jgi:hypothetical protein